MLKLKKILFYIVVLIVNMSVYGQSVTTYVGTGATNTYENDILRTEADLNNPTAIIVDLNGDVFFVDQGNNAIRRVDYATDSIEEYYAFFPGLIVGGVVSDNSDTLYFTVNSGNTSTLLWYNTLLGTYNSISTLSYPSAGLCVSNDSIFITSETDHIVTLYNLSTNVQSVFAGTPSSNDYSGDNGLALNAKFDSPTDILVGNDNNIYVCDKKNNRIRKIDRSNNNIITTYAGHEGNGFNGHNLPATSTSLNWPEGIAKSVDGTIYIADTDNHIVRRVNKNTGLVELVAGSGDSGFIDNTYGEVAQLNKPVKLAIGSNGVIYVSDNGNERIRKIEYCTAADKPNVLTNTNEYSVCEEDTILLIVDPLSNLNDQIVWAWYYNGCNEDFIAFGDTVAVKFADVGDYYVKGEKSCFRPSECANINIAEGNCIEEEVYFNSFSPNDDGINDIWIIPTVAEMNTVSIFNRWGDLIKEIPNYENAVNAWNGENNLTIKVSPGTYFYVIEDEDFETIKTGWLQVIR
jgi:gliding motility-associated-like protein